MSMAALRWVRTVKCTPTQKVILWALADMANDHAECWPSMPALVEATGLSDRGIQKAIPAMVDSGFLTVEKSRGGRSNKYHLTLAQPRTPFTPTPNPVHPNPEPRSPRSPRSPRTPNPVHPNPEPGSPPTPNPVHHQPRTRFTPTPNPVHPEPKRRKKERRKEETSLRSVVAQSCAPDLKADLPHWLNPEAWDAWCSHRLRLSKKGWTPHAAQLCLKALGRFRADGDNPEAVIEQSIAGGWTGLFALKAKRAGATSAKPHALDGWLAMAGADQAPTFDMETTAEEIH